MDDSVTVRSKHATPVVCYVHAANLQNYFSKILRYTVHISLLARNYKSEGKAFLAIIGERMGKYTAVRQIVSKYG